LKKIILSVLALLSLLAIAAAVYFNEVIFPQKIRSALIESLELATGKKVEMSSAKLDLFRGLVIKDLAVLDNDLWVVTAKEANARFLVIPLFKKQIIITALKLKSPRIFMERAKDNSINIVETFFKKPILFNGEYHIIVSRIMLFKAAISFKDSAFDPPLLKDINNAYLDLRLFLPNRTVFNAEFELPSELPAIFKVNGKYKALKKEWTLDIRAKDFYPKELSPYCKDWNFPLPGGRADLDATLDINNDHLGAKISMTSLGLEFSQETVKANINCALTANAEYDFNKKTLIYSGGIDIKNLALSGLKYLDKIDDIRGKAIFTESRFLSNNLTCTLAGLPVDATADLTDLKTGALNIEIKSAAKLEMLNEVLKNKFDIKLPAKFSGSGNLSLTLEYKLPIKEMPAINGHVDVSEAKIALDYNKKVLKHVNGRFKFTANQLSWENITFQHIRANYTSSGVLTNFEKPGIDIKLDSRDLSLKSLFAVNGNLITLSRFEGSYGSTEFSVYGSLDTTDSANIAAELRGVIKFELNENKELVEKLEKIMKGSKPSGRLIAKFALKGNINSLSSCAADVEVSSSSILLYGFKMEDFTMSYMQKNGEINIFNIQASLFGGTLDGSGRIEMASKDGAYQMKAEVKDLKIEKIKLDTAFKDYDISGSIHSRFGFKGYSSDSSKFSAWGKINISNGRLWQLNLFRGIGTLVFRKDFSSVIFKEGDCDFSIKDKTIFANDINLRSDLLNISGVARIGFDNSIIASLASEFTDEGLDAGKMAGVSAAIERYSIIEMTGTLKEPKVRFRPDLSNVVSDIVEGFFQQ